MKKPTANSLIAVCLLLGAAFSIDPVPRGGCATGHCSVAATCAPAALQDPPQRFSAPSQDSVLAVPSVGAVPPSDQTPAFGAGMPGSGETNLKSPPPPRPAGDAHSVTPAIESAPGKAAPIYTALAAFGATPATEASSPRLNLILPRAVQRGQTHTLEFIGQRLGDAEEIFFYNSGFSVQSLEKIDDNRVKAVVAVGADVPVGRYIAQVRTKTGISDYRPLWVNHLPTVAEVEPNNDLNAAQAIAMNVVVDGVVTNEDVDYFVVEGRQGQRLSVEVVAMRLGGFLFDPYIAILDQDRFELAVSDDSALGGQDGVCSVQLPSDGKYYVLVRESSFGGNDQCRYQLHVGDFPRPTAVFPAGGPVGQTIALQFLGDALGPFAGEITVSAEAKGELSVDPTDSLGESPSGLAFRTSVLPNAVEVEPNANGGEATPVEFPSAVNGILAEAGDQDFYRFSAKKGQVFDIEMFGRRIRSGVDPVIHLLKGDGTYLVGNDDSRGPDSYLRWTVPEDGEYLLWVHDHLNRGRADFVYRVEFQAVLPTLSIEIPRVEQFGQYRQTIVVPRGGRFGTLLLANRANFGGEIIVESEQLPTGITLQAQPMAANLNQMPVVFEAAEDAPIGGQLIEWHAKHADPAQAIRGAFRNSADFVLGEPNNSKYITGEVDQLAIAVVEKLPFRIEIQQPQSPIVQGGTKDIKIIVHRDEGFTGQVHVEFPFRSPGVGTRGNIQIPPDQTEGLYPLNAAGNSQVGSWPIYAVGMSNVGGPAWCSTQLATLEVATPYVTMEIPRVGCEQGETVLVACKLNHLTPFTGEAKAELFGLPPNCTVEAQTFTAETEDVVFKIQTTAETNAGKHRGVFCQVTIPVNGEPVVSRAGSFELQVDVPLPKEEPKVETPPPAAEAPPAETPPPPPVEKPLSRLEKLRLEAKKRQGN
jgi:hypothetical protein